MSDTIPVGEGLNSLYSVMVWVKLEREEEWLEWMKGHHVQAVVDQPGFYCVTMTHLTTGPAVQEGVSAYRMDYWAENMAAIDAYVAGPAKQLKQDLVDAFGSDARAERVLGNCVATFLNQAIS